MTQLDLDLVYEKPFIPKFVPYKTDGSKPPAGSRWDLAGLVLGNWTVVSFDQEKCLKSPTRTSYWVCVCICGNRHSVNANLLAKGKPAGCANCRSQAIRSGVRRNKTRMPKGIGVIGHKFGKWLVISAVPKAYRTASQMFECSCDCGTLKNFTRTELRKRAAKAARIEGTGGCKACSVRTQSGKSADMTDSIVGTWKVLSREGTSQGLKSTWLCECAVCGTLKTLERQSVKYSENKPDGRGISACDSDKCYLRTHNVSGTEFGGIIVAECRIDHNSGGNRKITAVCICTCGNETEYELNTLLTSKNPACATCIAKRTAYTGPRAKPIQRYLSDVRGRAKSRNKEFKLTEDYVLSIFTGKCALSGVPISLGDLQYVDGVHIVKNRTASLDRIDSSKGYIEGNVQWTTVRLNRMKLDSTESEFLELCKDVIAHKDII